MSKTSNIKQTYSWSLVGILMGLTFALKQGVKVIRILELQRHPTTLMFMK